MPASEFINYFFISLLYDVSGVESGSLLFGLSPDKRGFDSRQLQY